MYDDVMRVTESQADSELLEHLLTNAYPTVQWLKDYAGLHWVLMYGRQAYKVDGKLRFWGGMITEAVGGGAGLVDQEFSACERLGVDVLYGTKGVSLITHPKSGAVTGLRIKD